MTQAPVPDEVIEEIKEIVDTIALPILLLTQSGDDAPADSGDHDAG
jgi:hypothetical protein